MRCAFKLAAVRWLRRSHRRRRGGDGRLWSPPDQREGGRWL